MASRPGASFALLALACAMLLGSRATRAEVAGFTVTGDLTWASKYMTDGYKVAGDDPVLQPSVSVGAPWLQGVSLLFWSSLQLNRANQQYDELDLMARFNRDFFVHTPYSINVHGFFDYFYYPKIDVNLFAVDDPSAPQNKRGNKLYGGFALSELFPLAGSHLVPCYNVSYWLYWSQNRRDQFLGGAHHELALQYFHAVPRFIPGALSQYAGLSGSVNYNSGAFDVHPGWSHSTASLTLGAYALGGAFAASLNRQWTYEASVDPDNELWSTLSFTREF